MTHIWDLALDLVFMFALYWGLVWILYILTVECEHFAEEMKEREDIKE